MSELREGRFAAIAAGGIQLGQRQIWNRHQTYARE